MEKEHTQGSRKHEEQYIIILVTINWFKNGKKSITLIQSNFLFKT